MMFGHKRQWSFLKEGIKNDRIAHAYLFYGPKNIGKKKFAIKFAKLLSNTTGNIQTNPDLILIEPSQARDKEGNIKEGTRPTITISQISDLKSRLSLSAIGGGYKVAIINEAHLMGFDAQGTLLKLLEEPKGRTVIILLVQHPGQLFSTITSRCQPVRFNLLSRQEIEKSLIERGASSEKAQELSWLSFGRPEIAFNCFKNPEEEILEKKKIQNIIFLLKSPLNIRFQYAEKLSKERNQIFEVLDIWSNYLREVLLGRIENKSLEFFNLNNNLSINDLRKKISLIEKIRMVLSQTNANPRLALEILLMKI